jgi:hypothetical protein
MGGTASTVKAQEAVTENESGGLHFLELHLPSASLGIGSVIAVAVVAILACVLASRVRKWFTRPPRTRGQSRPHHQAASSVVYYSPGDPFPGVSLGLQRGRPQPAFDVERFAAIPPMTPPGASQTASEPPPAAEEEWINLPRP